MNLYIHARNGASHIPMRNNELLAQWGVRRLPDAGLPPRIIQGIRVWGKPKTMTEGRGHRLVAECPMCGHVTSAGHLHQHSAIHLAENKVVEAREAALRG